MKGERREDAAGDVEKRRSPVPSVPIALCLWWVFHSALIGLPRTGPRIFFWGRYREIRAGNIAPGFFAG